MIHIIQDEFINSLLLLDLELVLLLIGFRVIRILLFEHPCPRIYVPRKGTACVARIQNRDPPSMVLGSDGRGNDSSGTGQRAVPVPLAPIAAERRRRRVTRLRKRRMM